MFQFLFVNNGFVATHALGHMMYGCHKAIVVITGRAHCFHDFIYIYRERDRETERQRDRDRDRDRERQRETERDRERDLRFVIAQNFCFFLV